MKQIDSYNTIKGEECIQKDVNGQNYVVENCKNPEGPVHNPSFYEWQFPPMTVKQLARLLENKDVRVALKQLDSSFTDVFAEEAQGVDLMEVPVDQFTPKNLNNKRVYCGEGNHSEKLKSNHYDSYILDIPKTENLIKQPYPAYDLSNFKYIESDINHSRAKYSLKAFSEYDMVELKIICDSFHNKGTGVCRILAIHSGITLYNLHRCIAITLNIDKKASEEYLHAWIINDGTVYGGGRSCSPAMSRRLSLQTDRHTTYRQLVQLPVDEMGLVHKQCCAPITYIFGKIQCQIYLNDFLLQHTNSADLLWVPRCCEGSFGTTPIAENWKNFQALETFSPEFKVDLDTLNLSLMETRFSRNVASCRRTQRKRMKGIDQIVLRSYRSRIHEFFTDRMAIQKLASYVTRQASSYKRKEITKSLSNQIVKESFDYKYFKKDQDVYMYKEE